MASYWNIADDDVDVDCIKTINKSSTLILQIVGNFGTFKSRMRNSCTRYS